MKEFDMDKIYKARRDKVASWLKEHSVFAAVFEDTEGARDVAIRYLTGHPSDAILIITEKGESVLTAWDENLMKEKAKAAQAAKEKALAQEYAQKLEAVQVTVRAKSGGSGKLFGAVTSETISKALKEQFDMDIEKNKIVQGDPIKSFGSYTVKAKLGYEVSGNINLLVVEG